MQKNYLEYKYWFKEPLNTITKVNYLKCNYKLMKSKMEKMEVKIYNKILMCKS